MAAVAKWSRNTNHERITIGLGKWCAAWYTHQLWKTIKYYTGTRLNISKVMDFVAVIKSVWHGSQ